jgi:hypothetical protein
MSRRADVVAQMRPGGSTLLCARVFVRVGVGGIKRALD